MNPLRFEVVTLSYRRVGVLMETNLSLFCLSSLGGGGRGSDPICTMSRNLPFLGFDGAPKDVKSVFVQCSIFIAKPPILTRKRFAL